MWTSTSNGIPKTSKEHLKKNPLSIESIALIHSNAKALQKERISLVVHARQVDSLPSLATAMPLVFLGLGGYLTATAGVPFLSIINLVQAS